MMIPAEVLALLVTRYEADPDSWRAGCGPSHDGKGRACLIVELTRVSPTDESYAAHYLEAATLALFPIESAQPRGILNVVAYVNDKVGYEGAMRIARFALKLAKGEV